MITCTQYEIMEWDDSINSDLENDSLIADAAMDRISNDACIIVEELLSHLDELNVHIKNLDDEIDNFMKPEEKNAFQVIQDVTGIGNTSAQAIISVIGTDMSRFKTDRIFPRGSDCVRVIIKVQASASPARPERRTA